MSAFVVALVIAGIGLVVRGRRIGDHAVCRACRYDLTGRPAGAGRCSECGADLSQPDAILVGRRQRRPMLIVAGLLAFAAVPVVRQAAAVWADPDAYKPFSWLVADVVRQTGLRKKLAFFELRSRFWSRRLTAGQVATLAEMLLAVQADGRQPWDDDLGNLMWNLHDAAALSGAEWQRYARQSLRFNLRLRPAVRQSDPIPAELQQLPGRNNAVQFFVRVLPEVAVVDGRADVVPVRTYDMMTAGPSAALSFEPEYGRGMPMMGDRIVSSSFHVQPAARGLGTRTVSLAITAEVYEYRRGPSLPLRLVTTERIGLSAPVAFVADDAVTVQPADPAFAAAVRAMFNVDLTRSADTGRIVARLEGRHGPYEWNMGYKTPGHFDLTLRAGGVERHVGRVQARLADVSESTVGECDLPVRAGDAVDVVLRSPPDLARDSVDQTMYLEREVVIPGVRVK